MIKLGLIGTGRWAKNFIKTIATMPDVEIRAICSRTGESLEPYKGYDCFLTNDYRELAGLGLDGVIIATPPDTHFQMINFFLEVDIPILVEKPITLSLKDTLQIADKFKNAIQPQVLMVDFTQLYNPGFDAMINIWRNLRKEDLFIKSEGTSNGPFRKNYSLLYDRMPHDAAMCLSLLGSLPEWVECVANSHHSLTADYITAKLHFKDNCDAIIDISNNLPYKRRNFVVSYKKDSDLNLSKGGTLLEDTKLQFLDGETVPTENISPLQNVIEYFVMAIEDMKVNDSSKTNIDFAVRVDKIIDACKWSIEAEERKYL